MLTKIFAAFLLLSACKTTPEVAAELDSVKSTKLKKEKCEKATGNFAEGYCWFKSNEATSCADTCKAVGLKYDEQGTQKASMPDKETGKFDMCVAAANAVGYKPKSAKGEPNEKCEKDLKGIGCVYWTQGSSPLYSCFPATAQAKGFQMTKRICACD